MRAILCAIAALVFMGGCPKEPAPKSSTPPSAAPAEVSPRIVALSPAIAVTLRDLGHEREIVGRHAYDLILNPDTPVCGDQAGINYESLVRARPTHVFTQWGARQLPERLSAMATDQHWTLRDIPILTMDDIGTAVGTLDRSVRGVSDDAPVSPTAAQLQGALKNLLHPAGPRPDRSGVGKVLLLIGTAPPSALGPGSAHDELLRALGATPALIDAQAYVELTHEDLVRLAPDAIVLFLPRSLRADPGTGSRAGTEAGATPPDDPWRPLRPLNLPALRSGHVAVIDDPLAILPSTGMIGVGERMKTLLNEWDRK